MNETKDAIDLILAGGKEIGKWAGQPPRAFLTRVSDEIKSSRASALFPEPYKGHIALAVRMVADSGPSDPLAAVAAVYLAARMDVYFRILSGRLTSAGRWLTESAAKRTKAAMASSKWGKELDRGKRTNWQDERVSHLALAYKIMKLDMIGRAAPVFAQLDAALYATPVIVHAGDTIRDIGDRLHFARHRISYGEFGDISSEAHFLALLTAIVFYNQ